DLVPTHDAGRADLARRLAAACERLGDEDGALGALRQFLDAAGPGPAVAPAWRRLVELHARRGDPQAAARALIASADDVRTGARGPVEQKDLLVQLAEVYDRQLGRPGRARDTHERALTIDPRFQPSLIWLARDAWVRGDAAAAVSLYGRLAATETDDPALPPT